MENVNKEVMKRCRITRAQEMKLQAILEKQKTTFSRWLRKKIDDARVK